jgi:hypothetical protein
MKKINKLKKSETTLLASSGVERMASHPLIFLHGAAVPHRTSAVRVSTQILFLDFSSPLGCHAHRVHRGISSA